MKTDWNNVAQWYDNYLEGDDTYQAAVIAPNIMRLIDPKKGKRILDVACGQGYFARLCAEKGAEVVGVDQSAVLVEKAKTQAGDKELYFVGNAETLEAYKLETFDTVFMVLALENIKNITAVMEGIQQVTKQDGKVVFVLLHPSFRIPQHSDWGFDSKKTVQYRKVEKYLSEISIPIELSPFKGEKKTVTVTFHRSLQWYMKAFRNAGFAITNIEEWNSHKKSQAGPRQAAEDNARKEIPMFMAIELKKI
ncbi:MAG: methyltransferase domain-containing protein [Candidatus Paceibacterota bacterium]